jgi:hypothetical protein
MLCGRKTGGNKIVLKREKDGTLFRGGGEIEAISKQFPPQTVFKILSL